MKKLIFLTFFSIATTLISCDKSKFLKGANSFAPTTTTGQMQYKVFNLMQDKLKKATSPYNEELVQEIGGYRNRPEIRNSAETDLMLAVKNHRFNIAKFLLNAGANPNLQDNNGFTALIWAAVSKNLRMVKLLLDAGANPNLQDNDGDTALIIAVINNRIDIVTLLLNARANPNLQNNHGYTALILAATRGQINIITLLLNAGADPMIKNNDDDTALSRARDPEIRQLILDSMANYALSMVNYALEDSEI